MGVDVGVAGLANVEQRGRVVDAFRPVMQMLSPAHTIGGDHRLTTALGADTNLGAGLRHARTARTGALADTTERGALHDPTPDAFAMANFKLLLMLRNESSWAR